MGAIARLDDGGRRLHVHVMLGSLRRLRIILRLVDALIVMDSRLVIRVETMVTTSSLEVLHVGVDLKDATSNYLLLALLILLSSLLVA